MTTKDQLYVLIDQLDEEQAARALALLQSDADLEPRFLPEPELELVGAGYGLADPLSSYDRPEPQQAQGQGRHRRW